MDPTQGDAAMATHFLSQESMLRLVEGGESGETFVPAPTGGLAWLSPAGESPSAEGLSKPRAAQSPKGLLLPPSESMGRYGPQGGAATEVRATPAVIVGVRACELRARNYLDAVLLSGDFEDAAYRARREAVTVVACDCVDCTDSCFCTLVGGRPYATEGFDVNLTPVDGGFIAEAATDKGRQWLDRAEGLSEATPEQLARRDRLREEMTERVRKQNERFGFSADDQDQPKLPLDADEAWQTFAADCVECGACTHICPTCHCFYLYDQALGPEQFERIRTWDSCLLSTYHRMAGGANMKLTPRPRLYSRLANRVLHKFAYSPEQYGLLGCVGCGRCVDACIGGIDIREVVEELGE
jgi:ferredoxin